MVYVVRKEYRSLEDAELARDQILKVLDLKFKIGEEPDPI